MLNAYSHTPEPLLRGFMQSLAATFGYSAILVLVAVIVKLLGSDIMAVIGWLMTPE